MDRLSRNHLQLLQGFLLELAAAKPKVLELNTNIEHLSQIMSSNKKNNGKFVTSILIGGALGSVAALVFGRRKKKKGIAERIEQVLTHPCEQKKKSFFSRLFGRDKE